jgi:hypothetical protein
MSYQQERFIQTSSQFHYVFSIRPSEYPIFMLYYYHVHPRLLISPVGTGLIISLILLLYPPYYLGGIIIILKEVIQGCQEYPGPIA